MASVQADELGRRVILLCRSGVGHEEAVAAHLFPVQRRAVMVALLGGVIL
jgi:hypothetical protein